MNLKWFRRIDQRNSLYGIFKYQVRPSRNSLNTNDVRRWCQERWGPEREYIWVNGITVRKDNHHYKFTKRQRGAPTLLYLRDEQEALMFSLTWAK